MRDPDDFAKDPGKGIHWGPQKVKTREQARRFSSSDPDLNQLGMAHTHGLIGSAVQSRLGPHGTQIISSLVHTFMSGCELQMTFAACPSGGLARSPCMASAPESTKMARSLRLPSREYQILAKSVLLMFIRGTVVGIPFSHSHLMIVWESSDPPASHPQRHHREWVPPVSQ